MLIGEIDHRSSFRTRPARPTPPATRSSTERREARICRIAGIAAPFGELSGEILGEPRSPFREIFFNGAFRESIGSDAISFVISHQADKPRAGLVMPEDLSSTRDGTLLLFEDHLGLHFEFPPIGSGGAYLVDRIIARAFAGVSIRFIAEEEEWENGQTGLIRIVHQAAIRHIAAAPRPYYRGTSIEVLG